MYSELITPGIDNNTSHQLGEIINVTIQLLVDHDNPSFEKYVTDGGSTIETIDAVEVKQKRLVYRVSEPDGGQVD